MKPSIEKIIKFFNLEAERGFDNEAVFGGLDQILEHWEAEARSDNLNEDIVALISSRLRDYPRLSEKSRAETINGLVKRLQKETGDPTIKLKTWETKKPEQKTPPIDKIPEKTDKESPNEAEEFISWTFGFCGSFQLCQSS